MHLWNDSSEGGSSPQEVRYAQLIRNPEQSRVECGIFWVWGAHSLPLLTWECWELDRVEETDTPILALRWTWFWEGGLIFFLKEAADSKDWMRRMDAVFGCQGYWAEERGGGARWNCSREIVSPPHSCHCVCVCFMDSMKLDWFTTLCSQTTKSH